MESDVAKLPVHERLWAWFETHKKPTLWGAIALLVLGLATGFILWQQYQKEVNANDALSLVEAHAPNGAGQPDTPEALLKVAADYPGTDASGRALSLAAGALFEEGKYPEAEEQFRNYLRAYPGGPFAPQASLGIAACLDAQGKADDAATAYKNVIDRYPNDVVIPQAKFALARLYEAQGKLEQAQDLFAQIERADPSRSTSIGAEAGIHLAELAANHPALAPAGPTQTQTNAPPINLLNP